MGILIMWFDRESGVIDAENEQQILYSKKSQTQPKKRLSEQTRHKSKSMQLNALTTKIDI